MADSREASPGFFQKVDFQAASSGSLANLAAPAAAALKATGGTITVAEATTGGLIHAALQSCPGASSYITCGAVTYSPKKAISVLGADLSPAQKPENGAAYKQSKNDWTRMVANRQLQEVGSTWSICESGACGPTFNYADIDKGFTSIFVAGPVSKGITVQSTTNDRETNMWSFCKAALTLLAECVEESRKLTTPAEAETPWFVKLIDSKEDRYGGVEASVASVAKESSMQRFAGELSQSLAKWQTDGKQGIWMKVPSSCADFVGPVAAAGFQFHHAKPEYAMLIKWLPKTPCPLPMYAFTRIGVGGVVVNSKNEVLLVKERIAAVPSAQDSWKMPGGLADPAEDFADTVVREVREETGVEAKLEGVVSMRHSHSYPFGQSDIYVLVKLRATQEKISVDKGELQDAQWFSKEKIDTMKGERGQPLKDKMTPNNFTMVQTALAATVITAEEIPNSVTGRPTLNYSVSAKP